MKTVLLYSGGLDSTVLLYYLLSKKETIKLLSFDYGQRHQKEITYAKQIAALHALDHKIADLKGITHLFGKNSLTSSHAVVPEGNYTKHNMKQTIVPNRNMILLAIATSWAIVNHFDSVSYAAHHGDHALYPDCRNEFAQALDKAIQLAHWHQLSLNAPFINKKKTNILRLGATLQVPFEKTWSCYKGGELHCGRCGTCMERRKAFIEANIQDPTPYDNPPPLKPCRYHPLI
jgi:7-cyano-7-deazaguanine synthase